MMYGMGSMMVGSLVPAFAATTEAIHAANIAAGMTAGLLSALTLGIAGLAI